MIENLTWYEKVRIWLSDFSFMEKPLQYMDAFVDKSKIVMQNMGIWLRYILLLFLLTLLMVALKIIFRFLRNWYKASFLDVSESTRMRFWERYAQADEKKAFFEVSEMFDQVKKDPIEVKKVKKISAQTIGFDLFYQIMNALNQGMAGNEIMKILPSKYSMMDIAPLIDAIRSFRDFAARKILEPHSRERRHYARALKEMSEGRPQRAAHLMKQELMRQQKTAFVLKDGLLQQYARREAAQMSLCLALILGVYDTRLADKAYQRAIELNPKDSNAKILYGRFRQRLFGQNDKMLKGLFLNLAKNVDKTIQNYMLNYAIEMIRKTEVRARLDEIRSQFKDEKERYNEAVQIERLKVRELLKMARMRSIALEERIR
ncbi:MAG: hypothetical protein J6P93_03755 [Alphaproteobacteria bacterium]|nr:hypothetical protein [Alphaproteobacteria bacterium]